MRRCRKGDKLLQKKPPIDFITKKPNPQAEYESNYLTDDHEAIVDEAVWEAVQEKLEKNKEIEEAVGHRGGLPHFLYGKVFCGECGEPMTRRTVNGVGGVKCKTWICRQNRGKKVCAGKNIKEEDLLAKINQQLGWEQLDEERFLRDVERVDINGKEITVYENNTKEMAG